MSKFKLWTLPVVEPPSVTYRSHFLPPLFVFVMFQLFGNYLLELIEFDPLNEKKKIMVKYKQTDEIQKSLLWYGKKIEL